MTSYCQLKLLQLGTYSYYQERSDVYHTKPGGSHQPAGNSSTMIHGIFKGGAERLDIVSTHLAMTLEISF